MLFWIWTKKVLITELRLLSLFMRVHSTCSVKNRLIYKTSNKSSSWFQITIVPCNYDTNFYDVLQMCYFKSGPEKCSLLSLVAELIHSWAFHLLSYELFHLQNFKKTPVLVFQVYPVSRHLFLWNSTVLFDWIYKHHRLDQYFSSDNIYFHFWTMSKGEGEEVGSFTHW